MHPSLATDARALFDAGLRAVRPEALLSRAGDGLGARRPLDAYRRVVVTGLGKAALTMGGALAGRLGPRLDAGVLVVPHGYAVERPPGAPAVPARLRVLEAGHPVPDRSSEAAAAALLALARTATADDLVVALVSGGGTALAMQAVPGATRRDVERVVRLLLESGADIHAMNTVRRCLSRVGGGGLARAAWPAEVVTLVVSDVVGDDLAAIASGPTVQRRTTRADAAAVLRDYGLWERVPGAVRDVLGVEEPAEDAADDEGRVTTRIVGSIRDALEAARAEAEARGYAASVVTDTLTGEARDVGRRLAEALRACAPDRPRALLWGGETTVTVHGRGRGGRNQELALAAALALEGADRPLLLLSGGTDGRDGPTDAAGAWAMPETAAAGRRRGLDPAVHLADNDAYPFFEAVGSLLMTGPTHTNVMDLVVGLAG